MANNYSSWPVEKLEKEIIKIQGIIKTRKSRDKKEALAKVTALARKNGFELHELLNGKSATKEVRGTRPNAKKTQTRKKVAPKIQKPGKFG